MKLGILASGGGTNLQSLIDASEAGGGSAEITVVISNNSNSGALKRAAKHGIPALHLSGRTHPDLAKLDRAILHGLLDHGAEFTALAGYMKKLGPETLSRYRNRITNIHPALLPDFGGQGMYGLHVHQAVLAAKRTMSGATVHLVDSAYDEGPVLAQQSVPVKADDTPDSLQGRVLCIEHRIYPQTFQEISDGLIYIGDGTPPLVIRPLRLKTLESGGTFFGAFLENDMVGSAAIEPARDDGDTWYVEKLGVVPRRQSTGIGTILLDHACRGAAYFGAKAVSVRLIDKDTHLKSWYRQRGFEETGTRDFNHLPFTVCFMKRRLCGG